MRPFWPTGDTHFMSYGLGWFLQDYRGKKVVWHGGSIDGMTACVAMLPEERLGVVTLVNLRRINWDQIHPGIMFRVFDAYLGGAARDWNAEIGKEVRAREEKAIAEQKNSQKRVEGTRPSLPLEQYAGSYGDCLTGGMTVSYQEGKLILSGPIFSGEMSHYHYDTFELSWKDRRAGETPRKAMVTFNLDARGKVESIKVGPVKGNRFKDEAAGKAFLDRCR